MSEFTKKTPVLAHATAIVRFEKHMDSKVILHLIEQAQKDAAFKLWPYVQYEIVNGDTIIARAELR